MGVWRQVTPVPCQHIADYYIVQQARHPCIAWNLLQRGYTQWSVGRIEVGVNNLFGKERKC